MRRRPSARPSLAIASTLTLVALLAACSSSSSASGSSGGDSSTTATSTTSTTVAKATPTEVPGSAVAGRGAFLGPVFTVPVDGITMSYRQFGTGPELVIVAGQASPMSVWPVTLLSTLAAHWHVTMYDNRSLGLTTDDLSKPLTMEQMADDLTGLIGAVGLHRPAVFGWSTGGEIGLVAAVRHPSSIGHLAVTGAEPGGPTAVDSAPAITAALEDPNTPPDQLLKLLFGDDDAATKQYIIDLAAVPQTDVTPATQKRYADCESAYIGGRNYDADLRKITIPTLVMNGTADRLVPPINANNIAGLIPHSTLALEPGGHAWMIEDSAPLVTALTALLAR